MQDKQVNQVNVDQDREFDRKMRYINLMLAKWRIEEELNREYPDEMSKHRKRLAQMMLKRGVIKCEH